MVKKVASKKPAAPAKKAKSSAKKRAAPTKSEKLPSAATKKKSPAPKKKTGEIAVGAKGEGMWLGFVRVPGGWKIDPTHPSVMIRPGCEFLYDVVHPDE